MTRRTPLLLVLPLLALAGCAVEGAPTTTAPARGATTSAAGATPGASASGAAAACSFPKAGTAARQVTAPDAAAVKRTGSLTLTFTLTEGPVTVTIDRAKTPCAALSFETLAGQGYFDNTQCHRLTNQGLWVLQCGDPTGTGRGGPGYTFPDELTGTETYPAGTVAMANAGPNTNGSQFFFVYQDTQLRPNYTVLGQMDPAGLEVVKSIAAKGLTGSNGDGKPNATAKIVTAKAS